MTLSNRPGSSAGSLGSEEGRIQGESVLGESDLLQPDQTWAAQSGPIQPNPTCEGMEWSGVSGYWRRRGPISAKSRRIQPDQTCAAQSGQIRPNPTCEALEWTVDSAGFVEPPLLRASGGPMNPNRKRVLLTPALHKYVEEREMERRSQVHGFHERKLSAKSLHATRGEGAKQTKPDFRPGPKYPDFCAVM